MDDNDTTHSYNVKVLHRGSWCTVPSSCFSPIKVKINEMSEKNNPTQKKLSHKEMFQPYTISFLTTMELL